MKRLINDKKEVRYSAKDCAFLAVFVAIVIAVQLVLSIIPGVELVTVLFISYSFVVGARKGMVAATVFSILRQIVFGFFPTVLVLYLIYYNLLSMFFGLLGRKLDEKIKRVPIIVILACIGTIFFTLIDCLLTPLWYGYSKKATILYGYAAIPFMIPQVICTAVSVSILFYPLVKIFRFATK